MITSILKIKTLPSKQKEALEILRSLQEPLRIKHDCAGGRVYESYGEENCILYLEEWKTKEALYRHIQSDLYRRILSVMELAEETPCVEFHEFNEMQGMELIISLRQGS